MKSHIPVELEQLDDGRYQMTYQDGAISQHTEKSLRAMGVKPPEFHEVPVRLTSEQLETFSGGTPTGDAEVALCEAISAYRARRMIASVNLRGVS